MSFKVGNRVRLRFFDDHEIRAIKVVYPILLSEPYFTIKEFSPGGGCVVFEEILEGWPKEWFVRKKLTLIREFVEVKLP